MFENKFTWYLCNVVIYDGVESKIKKMVVKINFDNGFNEELEYVTSFIKAYENEAEMLKIDLLYEVSLDNIIAFREVPSLAEAYDDFITMYFPCR